MNKQQSGFTLIELIMVIVILGILAAVAVPKYVNLSDEAAQAATEGVAGALGAASAINYAAAKVGSADKLNITDCTQVGGLLAPALSSPFTITPGTTVDPDETVSCTVTRTDGGSANFIAHGVSS